MLKIGMKVKTKNTLINTNRRWGINDTMEELQNTWQTVRYVNGIVVKFRGYDYTWHIKDLHIPVFIKPEDLKINIRDQESVFNFNPKELLCEQMKS